MTHSANDQLLGASLKARCLLFTLNGEKAYEITLLEMK